jgi:glycosyltransferase involved in cell wall biosynthesis
VSNLRVLQILPELNGGGVERVTLDMVAGLRQAFPTTFVASSGGSLLPCLEQAGGSHFTLPLATKNPLQMLSNARRLAHLIRLHNIQLIHARSRAPAWSALWAARLAKIPLVTTYHSAYNTSNALKSFYNSIMTKGDRVIAISEFIMKHIGQEHPTAVPRVRLIHEGIDVEEFDPQLVTQQEIIDLRKTWSIPPHATVYLLPGRVTRIKGQTIFIEAIRRLNNPNVFGIILGRNQENSPYSIDVRRQCEGLPIRLVPHISQPRAAYAAADFVVYPSLAQEAFGRVTAEAGAMERVIIASNHGATSELCQDTKTGYLIPPGDSRALADAMIQTLKLSPENSQKMGKAARAHICKNFSLSKMCNKTIDLYRELVH